MTTIATDGKSMAADRRITGSFSYRSVYPKIVKREDGAVAGAAGITRQCEIALEWFGDGCPEDERPEINDPDVFMIAAFPNGKVIKYEGKTLESFEVPNRFAIGSGAAFAIGAMDAGAGPDFAVRIASDRDRSTGDGIDVLCVGKEA